MISLKKRNQGFTIIELLIVIVVIGILALLVITTYSGIQAKARNSQRQSDIKNLQTALEGFYQDKGYYPTLGQLNTAAFLDENLRGLDTEALSDPSNPGNTTLVAAPAERSYSYQATDSDGAACAADADEVTTCARYTITATYEGEVNGATTFSKRNLD